MSGLIALDLGRVTQLELVNPPLNLVTRALLEELAAALATIASSPPGDVRAVVVSGRGEAGPARMTMSRVHCVGGWRGSQLRG